MKLIDFWLNTGSDFSDGVTMLASNDGSKHLPKNIWNMLQQAASNDSETQYLRGKLIAALQKTALATTTTVTITRKMPPPPETEDITFKTSTSPPRAKELHKEHAHTHAQMVEADTDAERAEHATKIMEEIVPALDNEYDRLRNGGTPTIPEKPGASSEDLRKLQSLRTRISRIRNKLMPKADTKRKRELEEELQLKLAEVAQLETLLA